MFFNINCVSLFVYFVFPKKKFSSFISLGGDFIILFIKSKLLLALAQFAISNA